jgi:hypothetical protein
MAFKSGVALEKVLMVGLSKKQNPAVADAPNA